jgi:FAD/FMN-containing dehydrogenase
MFKKTVLTFTLFASHLLGEDMILPNHEAYENSRLVSNYYTSKNSRPDAIIYCETDLDVQNGIKWAARKNLPVRIRSGGHNHEAFSTGSGVVIDVSRMKKIEVDRRNNIATVQPGITGGELYSLLGKEGLTQVGGTCADVGISGLALTGGMGPLLRRYGLTCDNLLSIELVKANGDIIHATKDNEYQDLFWACRGGGAGNFGVVTAITMKVYPATSVTWFNIGWDWNAPLEEIIHIWQKLFTDGDKKWFSHLDIWAKAFPTDKLHKMPIKVLGVYYGTPEEATKELEPFLKIGNPKDKTIKLVDWVQSIKGFEDATAVYVTDKPEYKSSGAFVMQPLPKEAVRIVLDALKTTSSPLLNFLLFSMGGACADIPPADSAYFYRKALFFAVYSTQWLKELDDKEYISEVDALRSKLLPYTEGDYVGNPDRNLKDYLRDYYGDNVEKLRHVKQKYDPQNLFRFEQGIPPAKS